jgi:uncharacterized protein (UPF0335 family)
MDSEELNIAVANEAFAENKVYMLEKQLKQANERIKRLEEAGDELRECASRIGTVASGEGSVIRHTEEAIQAWDKEAKL